MPTTEVDLHRELFKRAFATGVTTMAEHLLGDELGKHMADTFIAQLVHETNLIDLINQTVDDAVVFHGLTQHLETQDDDQ